MRITQTQFYKKLLGSTGERIAYKYLKKKGYKILEKGYTTKFAEADLIALYGDLLVFIEVKRRSCIEQAWSAISMSQAQRLRRAAETYISKTGWTGCARFDVIFVCGHKIYWVKNAI